MMAAITTAYREQALLTAPRSPQASLTFTSSVPRHLVHRSALAEVLLTDWHSRGEDTYRCAAQWPRGHSLYRLVNGRHDPLLIAETIRQTGILLAHSAKEVPLEWKFIMDRIVFSTYSTGLRAGLTPADIVIEAALSPLRRATRTATHLRLDTRLLHEDRPFGTGSVWMRCVAPAVYQRLRGEYTRAPAEVATVPPPVDQELVGMATRADVVLGATSDRKVWPLRVPTEHPVLFDHPLDHVPGMLVLEGFRQAGRASLGLPDAQLTECDLEFTRYLEVSSPSFIAVNVRTKAARPKGTLPCA